MLCLSPLQQIWQFFLDQTGWRSIQVFPLWFHRIWKKILISLQNLTAISCKRLLKHRVWCAPNAASHGEPRRPCDGAPYVTQPMAATWGVWNAVRAEWDLWKSVFDFTFMIKAILNSFWTRERCWLVIFHKDGLHAHTHTHTLSCNKWFSNFFLSTFQVAFASPYFRIMCTDSAKQQNRRTCVCKMFSGANEMWMCTVLVPSYCNNLLSFAYYDIILYMYCYIFFGHPPPHILTRPWARGHRRRHVPPVSQRHLQAREMRRAQSFTWTLYIDHCPLCNACAYAVVM